MAFVSIPLDSSAARPRRRVAALAMSDRYKSLCAPRMKNFCHVSLLSCVYWKRGLKCPSESKGQLCLCPPDANHSKASERRAAAVNQCSFHGLPFTASHASGKCTYAHGESDLVFVSLEERARRGLIPSATQYRVADCNKWLSSGTVSFGL